MIVSRSCVHPGRLTAGTYSHHPFRKENDLNQTSMIMFRVNLQGCRFHEIQVNQSCYLNVIPVHHVFQLICIPQSCLYCNVPVPQQALRGQLSHSSINEATSVIWWSSTKGAYSSHNDDHKKQRQQNYFGGILSIFWGGCETSIFFARSISSELRSQPGFIGLSSSEKSWEKYIKVPFISTHELMNQPTGKTWSFCWAISEFLWKKNAV